MKVFGGADVQIEFGRNGRSGAAFGERWQLP